MFTNVFHPNNSMMWCRQSIHSFLLKSNLMTALVISTSSFSSICDMNKKPHHSNYLFHYIRICYLRFFTPISHCISTLTSYILIRCYVNGMIRHHFVSSVLLNYLVMFRIELDTGSWISQTISLSWVELSGMWFRTFIRGVSTTYSWARGSYFIHTYDCIRYIWNCPISWYGIFRFHRK